MQVTMQSVVYCLRFRMAWRKIMYGSKSFIKSQRRWCTTHFFFVITQFSFYLQGRDFVLRTDKVSLWSLLSFHNKVIYVFTRWLYYLEPYRPYRLVVISDICQYFGSLINQKGWKLQHAFATLKFSLVSENPCCGAARWCSF